MAQAGDFQPILLTRDPAAGRETLAEYQAAGGYQALRQVLAGWSPERLCQELHVGELRGRGGAGFPTGRKWDLARHAPGERRHVVANGGEHEPGSRKDRVLVATHPHKVLEGMALCAFATGAESGVLYLIEDMAEALAAAEAAIGEARAAGYLGRGLLGSDFSFDVRVHRAPTTYVAGEETAAIEAIEGRPPKPRKKPPYPGQAGLGGQPTTVNNVETLAHVPAIVRSGGAWFRALGTAGAGGSMLFTLGDAFLRPGVYELPLGTPFRRLLVDLGGGLKSGRAIRAFLPALSSGFLPASDLDLPMAPDAVKKAGSGLGCGGVSVLEQGECAVERCLEIARFFMAEQCGQCPPCRMETNTIAAVLEKVRGGGPGDYRGQIVKVAAFAAGKGYCSLIEMAAAPVLSALHLFPADFEHHAAHGTCPGG